MVHWRLTMTVITCIYVQYVYIHRCIYFRHYACTPPQFFNGNFFVFILHSLMYFMWISWYSKKIHALKSKDLKAFDFDGNLIIIIKKKKLENMAKGKRNFRPVLYYNLWKRTHTCTDVVKICCAQWDVCLTCFIYENIIFPYNTSRYTSFFKLDNILGKIAVVQFSW